MSKLDPESEQHFLEQFKRSAKSSGKLKKNSIASFDRNLKESMTHAWVPRPWAMRLAISYYRARLRFHERQLATTPSLSPYMLNAQIELVDSLRFAVHYGHRGNAQQRTWCLQQIDRYRVAPLAAPFLVWNRVINIRSQAITFGHWDWILGIFTMYPVFVLFVYALCIALSPASPIVRAVFTTAYLAAGCGTFAFYKSSTFDVFRVGLRYFRPDGWRYTPLQR